MTELTSHDHGERIGRLEGIIEQINQRLSDITRRLDSLEINHRRDFRWLIGLSVGYLGYHRRTEIIWRIAATSHHFETCRSQVVKDA